MTSLSIWRHYRYDVTITMTSLSPRIYPRSPRIFINLQRVAIKTSVLEEKKQACELVCIYIQQLVGGFGPYLEEVCICITSLTPLLWRHYLFTMTSLTPLLWRHLPRYYDVTNPFTMTSLTPLLWRHEPFYYHVTNLPNTTSLTPLLWRH